MLAANKMDVPEVDAQSFDGWRLGLGEPLPVSAEHGRSVERLIEEIESHLPPPTDRESEAFVDADDDGLPNANEELHVAIVGRPNVGKSSLVNRLVGDDRVTVSSKPGTTRDAIDVMLTRDGRRFVLVDTAGIRRRARVETRDESVGILMTRRRSVERTWPRSCSTRRQESRVRIKPSSARSSRLESPSSSYSTSGTWSRIPRPPRARSMRWSRESSRSPRRFRGSRSPRRPASAPSKSSTWLAISPRRQTSRSRLRSSIVSCTRS
ncbi:MAG: GTP-binding protein [Acidobacteria bacterium]|nr:GTP-binding protein [Acidobacteriota bacterium]